MPERLAKLSAGCDCRRIPRASLRKLPNRDQSHWPDEMTSMTAPIIAVLAVAAAFFARGEEPLLLKDKTLVAWVSPANLTQRGGSVLTLDDRNSHFDGIVFGEIAHARWMAGSDFYRRTAKEQEAWPAETANPATIVQVAIVYRDREIIAYRNGQEYSRHTIDYPQAFGPGSVVVIGPRHLEGWTDCFAGAVEDVRIYDRALSREQIEALKPKARSDPAPWAWWTFEEAAAAERTGRFPFTRLMPGAKVEYGRLLLDGKEGALVAARRADVLEAIVATQMEKSAERPTPPKSLVLSYHLMHPGGDSAPGDPNAAFCLDGVYHLHYIVGHIFQEQRSFSFMHVTSPDMLHWTWHKTSLQPSFTGHGMFSGTGFLTKEGKPAVIYHGQGSGRNQIAVAKDASLESWEKPYPIEPLAADGKPAKIPHWDPDCFLIGDSYYATSGGRTPALLKSADLKSWTYLGDFLQHDLPGVVIGEDISCGNFFKLGSRWMLLCISHSFGCRYYLGDWDAKAEQFVPETHGRMNWRREGESLFKTEYRDFFAPESVLTPDGRRVMWAWCATLDRQIDAKTIQSLPRELSLPEDGVLRIKPLRELASLRYEPIKLSDLKISPPASNVQAGVAASRLADLDGDALEIRIVVARAEAERKRFGFQLFVDQKDEGLPILIEPESGALRLGATEAPFAVADLPKGEDVEIRIFIDKYLLEVFVNDRQAMIAAHMDYRGKTGFNGYSFGDPTTIKSLEIWKLKPTNQGFLEAEKNRIWEPATE